MKNIILIALITFVTIKSYAQTQIIMTLYDFTPEEIADYSSLDIPKDFFCEIRVCPTKYKAEKLNLFSLYGTTFNSVVLELPKKIMKKIKMRPNIVGFVSDGSLKIYHLKKGLIKEIEGIRVLAGDK